MADPVVHITAGVPDSGTGNITTLGAVVAKQPALGTAGSPSTDVISVQGVASGTALPVSVATIPSHAVTNAGTFAVQLADGASTTLGSKADAKSTATDTTAITLMQVSKQISASAQTIATNSGAALPAGTNIIGKVGIDQTTDGTTNLVRLGSETTKVIGNINDQYSQYEVVTAGSTAQALGASGATGDYLAGVLCFPATAGCGVVTILDNATTIGTFPGGGTTALPSLVPFLIPVGLVSVSGAWKITTGSNVQAVGIGKFT